MSRMWMCGGALWLAAVMGGAVVWGQTGAAADAKAPAFEVVSIKPNNSGMQGGSWGMTGRTFRGRNLSIAVLLMQASFPTGSWSLDRLKGVPSWAMDEHYDIMATVDDATAESWKALTPQQQLVEATPLVLAMLVERCKLVEHKVDVEIPGYALVVGKGGPKMKEAVSGEPVPANARKQGGAWMLIPIMGPITDPNTKQVVTYIQISMAELAEYLGRGKFPMVDQTGLKGKYDFELPRHVVLAPEGTDGVAPAAPAANGPAEMWDWSAIGLELKPIKLPGFNVVIDHLERPTAN